MKKFVIRTIRPMQWELYTPVGTMDLNQRLVPFPKENQSKTALYGEVFYWTGDSFNTLLRFARKFTRRGNAERRAFQIATALMSSLIGELEVHEFVGRKIHKAPRKAIRLQLQQKRVAVDLRRAHGRGGSGRGRSRNSSGRSLQEQAAVATRQARAKA